MSTADATDGLRRCATIRVTRRVAALWTVVAAATVFGFAYCFDLAFAAIDGGSPGPITVSAAAMPDLATLAVGGVALFGLVVVPHELLHGLAMSRYGGEATYGVGVSKFLFPYAYAQSDGGGFTRNQLLVVTLAPLAVVTPLGLAVYAVYPAGWLAIPLAVNAAGSIADLWTAATVLRYPSDVRVAGLRDGPGFSIYVPDGVDATESTTTRALSAFVLGTVVTVAAITVALFGLVLASLAAGSGTVVVGDPGGSGVLFGHEYDPTSGTARVRVGERAIATASAVGGLVWAVVDLLRSQRRNRRENRNG